jgi:UDP-N-acetylglucosamine transferase subunit ALG13
LKHFRNLGILAIAAFSFFYTEKIANLTLDKNELYQSIKEESSKYNEEYINAFIEDDHIVPGLNGKTVNIKNSFYNMKDLNTFNSYYLIYDTSYPEITIENNIKLFWGTGKENYDEINGRIRKRHNLIVKPYFENAAEIMAASDLVISRAGASTISELIQLEKPALMIPYDFVGQKENADVLEFVNGGKMYTNDEVQEAIEEAICLIKEPDMLEFMGLNIKSIKKGNATENIINSMEK